MSPSFLAQRILPFVPMSGAIYIAYFEKMYKKIVPKAVREYIEGTTLSTVSDPVSEEKVIHNDPQLQPEPEPETKSNPISNPGGFWS